MIKGLTDILRPPRLGKIRLGEKSEKGFPISRDYFVCPDEVKAVFGDEPTELDIMFISDDIEQVFPAYYKMYGSSSGLKCKGDGEIAMKINAQGEFEEQECPGTECPDYEKKQCRRIGSLKFLLPKVNGLGLYQIDTSSWNSILNIYSMIGPEGLVRSLTKGRIKMIPFRLTMAKEEVQTEGKKQKVPIMKLHCDEINLSNLMSKKPALEEKPASAIEHIEESESKLVDNKTIAEIFGRAGIGGITEDRIMEICRAEFDGREPRELMQREAEHLDTLIVCEIDKKRVITYTCQEPNCKRTIPEGQKYCRQHKGK